MIFKTITGSSKKLKYAHKYRIKWGGKSLSKIQKRVKTILHPYWESHIVFEELPVVGTKLSIDFYNATLNLAIEVQGVQHTEYNKFFHNGRKTNFLNQLRRDEEKLRFCEANEIKMIEIHEKEKEDFEKLELFLKGDYEFE